MRCSYMLVGVVGSAVLAVLLGVAFHFLESDHERTVAVVVYEQLTQFVGTKSCVNMTSIKALGDVLRQAPTGGVRLGVDPANPVENLTNWNLQNTVFLTLQILGSVGYGNAPPRTTGGRVFCVFYALFGIPLFIAAAIGVSQLLVALAERVRRLLVRLLLCRPPVSVPCTGHHLACALILFVLGLIFFVFIPAAIFTALETWTYAEALYSCFITVLVIGFGDYVPGSRTPANWQPWYRLAVGFWILIALFWFGGVIGSLKNALHFYTDIHEPLAVGDDDRNGQKQEIIVKKNWRRLFDEQWNKLRPSYSTQRQQGMRRRLQGVVGQRAPVSTPQVSPMDVVPVYGCPGQLLYPVIASDALGRRVACVVPANSLPTNVDYTSRVPVNSGNHF